jgi:hypothetical protein
VDARERIVIKKFLSSLSDPLPPTAQPCGRIDAPAIAVVQPSPCGHVRGLRQPLRRVRERPLPISIIRLLQPRSAMETSNAKLVHHVRSLLRELPLYAVRLEQNSCITCAVSSANCPSLFLRNFLIWNF